MRAENVIEAVIEHASLKQVGLQEVFAYGRTSATFAGIRFTTEQHMRQFLMDNKGADYWVTNGGKIFFNIAHKLNDETEPPKLPAMRKFVRAVCEYHGPHDIDEEVANLTDVRYKAGLVNLRGDIIAKWSYKADAFGVRDTKYKDDFDELMKEALAKAAMTIARAALDSLQRCGCFGAWRWRCRRCAE
eukprot:TRINITY_DN87417_c0_g1_i1.p1 TRINITY_DN87417_c0_g1~~TRINITY_DN87417_c0_g1_i1.p1  ORF type:complete len:214 (+),score=28.87 TRINITY_DN87417_c0_g1_i1:80-643(+)